MAELGYRRYRDYFDATPLRVIEWRDDKSDAVGWLIADSLRGGAAGGGNRIRLDVSE